MSQQQIKLQIETGERFKGGEKLLKTDLAELGLDEEISHMKITFDNDKTYKYTICAGWVVSLSTCFWPIYLIFLPGVMYGTRKWLNSGKATVTDKQLILKQGYYGCCCCCWNESTKSVPLDKITDLQIQQGCLQRMYDVHEIRVETASATKEAPEMQLIGLHQPREIRAKILKARDAQSDQAQSTGGYSFNPLLPNQKNESSTEELQKIIASQQETLVEIKDVLQDMRTALVSMDNKM
eukprot:438778_1